MNDELEKLADALTRDHRDGSWVMNPKGAFLKGYDEGYKKAREWVSVKERLPEEYCMCLVSIINARDSIASFNGEVFSLYRDEAGLEGDITHWMPLPDKPEGVE